MSGRLCPGDLSRQVGARVCQIRESQGLSQEELGAHLGVSQPTVSRIEKGGRALTVDELGRVAELLKTTAIELLGGRGAVAAVGG